MSDPSETHDRIARNSFTYLMKQCNAAGVSYSEAMVILESVVLGVLLANERVHGVQRRTSAEMLESMTQAVLTRIAERPETAA